MNAERLNMVTSNLDELYQLIYYYYPLRCAYSSVEYQNSEKFKRLKKVINNNEQRIKLDKVIYCCLDTTFQNNYVKKWTSVDYPSIHYTILLHKNQPILDDDEELLDVLNNRRLDLDIYISLLSNYYYSFVVETTREDNGKLSFICYQDDLFTPDYSKILNKCMKKLGYCKLDSKIVHCQVEDVNTELKDTSETTIFHCLFSDLESNY